MYLPKVNLINVELYNHSFNVNGSTFKNNLNFHFRLDGFYSNSSITNNLFQSNKCKPGCFLFAGTEKDFEVVENRFLYNAISR